LATGGGERIGPFEAEVGGVDGTAVETGGENGEDFGVFASILCILQEWYKTVTRQGRSARVINVLEY
jgi:hypothetical protein